MTKAFAKVVRISWRWRVLANYKSHQTQKAPQLDDGWPESEKGDCQAIPSKEIVKIELSKSHDFFIQSVIEQEVAKKLDLNIKRKDM